MASGPITSWQIDGETMETMRNFIFLGSKITTDGDCSHVIKRRLLLGRKAMTNLNSLLKSRDITLPTKVHLVKAMVFPVVMYGCESRSLKKAEHWRIDAFELWCWRRLLRVPWTARRSDQCILKEISPEHSLERLMLKLKLQYFGHLMRRTSSLENTLMLGKTEDGGRRGRQRMRWLDGITNAVDMMSTIHGHHHGHVWVGSRSWWWTGKPGMLQSMGLQRVGQDWATELNWTEYMYLWPSQVVLLVKKTSANAETQILSLGWEDPWRRKRQPTPVFLPGESQGRVRLVGCRLWGRTESDTTEATKWQ